MVRLFLVKPIGKTKFNTNPQLTTIYCQKAPIAQYVHRSEAQIASCVFLCNMFDLYHAQSSRRYFDRKYVNRRMRFLFAKLTLGRFHEALAPY